ncbi:MAG: minor capsid protein [Chlorobi bacterium]|nr:minor capsid protein [Chlorobiota bacterium]
MSGITNLTLDDLKFAFDLTPEKAVEYFEEKGIKISGNWQEIADACKENAFTLSRVKSLDLLTDFKNALETALKEGHSAAEFRQNIKNMLQDKGWLAKQETPDNLKSAHRLNNIYRTNMQNAFSAGRYKQSMGDQDAFPYVIFYSTIDKKTTKECDFLHKKAMSLDDAKLNKFYPPGHYQCRRRAVSADSADLKTSKITLLKGSHSMKYQNEDGFNTKPGKAFSPDKGKYSAELVKRAKSVFKK